MANYWHCRIIRSTIVRGRITDIYVDDTFHKTGSYLFKHKDIPENLEIFDEKIPLLASENVEYYGQPIALILAESKELLNTVEAMINISYELVSPLPSSLENSEQVFHDVLKIQGNPAAAWKNIDERIEQTHVIDTHGDFGIEGKRALATWKKKPRKSRTLDIRAPIVWPHLVVTNLAQRIPNDRISVNSAELGMFRDYLLIDGTLMAMYVSLVAWLSEKNVSLNYSRQEQLLYGSHQPIIHVRHCIGLNGSSRLEVCDMQVDINTGAFGMLSDELTQQVLSAAIGFYRIPHWSLQVRLYRTSLPPMSIFYGLPATIIQIPIEVQANRIAAASGINPLEWRVHNLLKKGDIVPPEWKTPEDLDSSNALGILNDRSDYVRKYSAYELLRKIPPDHDRDVKEVRKGIGLAYGFQPSGFSVSIERRIRSRVRVELRGDGSLHVYAYILTDTMMRYLRQIISEELDMEGDKVVIHTGDDDEIPDSGPVCLSRSLTVVSDSIRRACVKLQKQRFQKPLPLTVEMGFRASRNWNTQSLTGDPFIYRTYGAAVVELKLDPVTYIPQTTRIWMALIEPSFFDKQRSRSALEGNIMNCLNWIGTPTLRLGDDQIACSDHPHILSSNPKLENMYLNHNTNTPFYPQENQSIPDIDIHFIPVKKNRSQRTGYRNKRDSYNGFRNLPWALIPPAYLSALSQASNRKFNNIPSDSQAIFRHFAMEEDTHSD